ncbi:MAG: hypothetical protein K8S21_12955 [Gemmatimonadetes bacterium]|nr:hypothetical protein [Gemmatimonadota bacterium]
MTPPSRIRSLTNGLGLEIEKLIRQLPGADPMLRGDPAPLDPPPPRRSVATFAAVSPHQSAPPAAARARSPEYDRRIMLLGVWLRTSAAAGLGAAVLYWPYAHDCGLYLHLYLGVIAAVLVSGGWASIMAWRSHVALAHLSALVVFFWGIVLAAEQVLPRIGYAAIEATWMCGR